MKFAPSTILRKMRPLSGVETPKALSRLIHEAIAWETGHTPQIRCVYMAASRGSRAGHDDLETAEHRAGAFGIYNLLLAADFIDGHLELEMAFNASYRINGYRRCHLFFPSRRRSRVWFSALPDFQR